MPQLLFAGFPEGAIRIGLTLSILKKESRVTYFLGADNYFSHFEADPCGQRFAIATLISFSVWFQCWPVLAEKN